MDSRAKMNESDESGEADEGALSLRRPNGRTDAAAVVAAKQSKGEGSADEVIDRRPNSISNINIGNEGGRLGLRHSSKLISYWVC